MVRGAGQLLAALCVLCVLSVEVPEGVSGGERSCASEPGAPVVLPVEVDGLTFDLAFDYCDDLGARALSFVAVSE